VDLRRKRREGVGGLGGSQDGIVVKGSGALVVFQVMFMWNI
jgi:hypothetical protein